MKNLCVVLLLAVLSRHVALSEFVNEIEKPNVTHRTELENDAPLIVQLPKDDVFLLNHWSPWKRQRTLNDEDEEEEECEEQSSIDEFPDDLFTQEQRLQGAIVLHFIGAIYFFTMTALVINNYFIPAVECICEDLKIGEDVGAAVFMATATATPELFTNLISTFIADSDLGLGAIIGSMMFNILGVAAVSSLVLKEKVKMNWVPIVRDCVLYSISITCLVVITWDGYIIWYEALILSLLLVPYFLIMFQSERIIRLITRIVNGIDCCNRDIDDVEKSVKENKLTITKNEVSAVSPAKSAEESKDDGSVSAENERKLTEEKEAHELLKQQRQGLHPCPNDSIGRKIFWYYTWPIRLVFFCTLVNTKSYRKWYPLTFFVSIVWIGAITYMLFFMLVIIGYTFSIPESIMGLTAFAYGACTPETITGLVMARKGLSGVSVSNCLGSSTLAILVGLGLPWFFRAVISTYGQEHDYVHLHSNGMEYIILSMLALVAAFLVILSIFRFELRKMTGLVLILTYFVFLTLAILMELGVIVDLICIPVI